MWRKTPEWGDWLEPSLFIQGEVMETLWYEHVEARADLAEQQLRRRYAYLQEPYQSTMCALLGDMVQRKAALLLARKLESPWFRAALFPAVPLLPFDSGTGLPRHDYDVILGRGTLH